MATCRHHLDTKIQQKGHRTTSMVTYLFYCRNYMIMTFLIFLKNYLKIASVVFFKSQKLVSQKLHWRFFSNFQI